VRGSSDRRAGNLAGSGPAVRDTGLVVRWLSGMAEWGLPCQGLNSRRLKTVVPPQWLREPGYDAE